MDTTAVVAVVGVISTPLVAIAGYLFNDRRAREDRAATRDLAEDSHAHERQLAEGQREHEVQVRRGERAYTDRRQTYVELLRHAMILVERVDLTQPIITFENQPEPPPNPPTEEWRNLQARVGADGSPEVGEAMEAFYAACRAFFIEASTYRAISESPSGDFARRGGEDDRSPHRGWDDLPATSDRRPQGPRQSVRGGRAASRPWSLRGLRALFVGIQKLEVTSSPGAARTSCRARATFGSSP